MNSLILLALLSLLGTCVVTQTTQTTQTPLMCHKCAYPCVTESTETCKAGEMCATSKAKRGHLHLTKKGCLSHDQCSKEETDKYMGVDYKVSHTCCDTSLCNKKE